MRDITPDICDQFEDQVILLSLPLQNFGQRTYSFMARLSLYVVTTITPKYAKY